MARNVSVLAWVALCAGLVQWAGAAPPPPAKGKDLSASVQEKTRWTGLSHLVERPTDKRANPKHETALTIVSRRDGEFVADYWLTVGPNGGNKDSRGLRLKGTIDSKGRITASPSKILAGSWQNALILEEKWDGEVVEEEGKEPRIVLHRHFQSGAVVEIGVSKGLPRR
jgi:hypothetical protein